MGDALVTQRERDRYLVIEVELRVHLDGLPVAHAVLVDATQQTGILLLIPRAVKVGTLHMATHTIPDIHTHGAYICALQLFLEVCNK